MFKPPEAAGAGKGKGKGKGGRGNKGGGGPAGGAGGGEREAVVAAKGEKLKEEMAQVFFSVFFMFGGCVDVTSHGRQKIKPPALCLNLNRRPDPKKKQTHTCMHR